MLVCEMALRLGDKMIRRVLNKFFWWFDEKEAFHLLSDSRYIKIIYWLRFGRRLNLNNPITFNEKLQWLKLYYRNPKYTLMVDKYDAKKYVAGIIGERYIIPTLGIWDDFDEIKFDRLPEKFVLKCTHNSGGVVICHDKTKLDISETRKKINRLLHTNYYQHGREWPYKNVKPRIIAEKYMEDESEYGLKDYKLMCFNGKVKCSFVCSNRNVSSGLNVNFYDRDWSPLPFERHYSKNPDEITKPYMYEEMIRLAEILARDLIFVRVDFYEIGGKIYFGELTFFPGGGLEEFTPEEYDNILGSWINLPTGGRLSD